MKRIQIIMPGKAPRTSSFYRKVINLISRELKEQGLEPNTRYYKYLKKYQ